MSFYEAIPVQKSNGSRIPITKQSHDQTAGANAPAVFASASETGATEESELPAAPGIEPDSSALHAVYPQNYRITADKLTHGGAKTRFNNNIEAIRTLRRLSDENRPAHPDEMDILARYAGWGGLPQAFDQANTDWKREYDLLKELLEPGEYESARASTLNAHYTTPAVIHAIFEALEHAGFKSGRVLEPAMGIGNFFGVLPKSMADSRLVGVELDKISGEIARALYPEADILIQGFETTRFPDGYFDLAVGNIPFGAYKLTDARYDKQNLLIHDYSFHHVGIGLSRREV